MRAVSALKNEYAFLFGLTYDGYHSKKSVYLSTSVIHALCVSKRVCYSTFMSPVYHKKSQKNRVKIYILGICVTTASVVIAWLFMRDSSFSTGTGSSVWQPVDTAPIQNTDAALFTRRIKLKDKVLFVEIADTPKKRQTGLSYRTSLSPFDGMLFVFDEPGSISIWMKDMRFPLDIVWFNADNEIIDIAARALPEGSQPQKIFTGKGTAKHVLEVPAGLSDTYQLHTGDTFIFCETDACDEKEIIQEESPAPHDVVQKTAQPATEEAPLAKVIYDVPFTSQAPFADWKDPRQQEGCEEASILMVSRFLKSEGDIEKEKALEEIFALAAYQEKKYGYFENTSAADTAKLLIDYYGVPQSAVEVSYDVTVEKIKSALAHGAFVITPMNGQILGNPNYTGAGPARHMVLIIGYDDRDGVFVTNDPGTRRGKG